MKILLLGSGGREHALARSILLSPLVTKLYVAPGNAGIASIGNQCACVSLDTVDPHCVLEFVQNNGIDLTVVGPEAPLAHGVANVLGAANHKVFGPSKEAAELETSKAEAKSFMQRWNLPTARSQTFTDFEAASSFLENAPWPFVIKASGLAAGKGVILPDSKEHGISVCKEMLVDERFGEAGRTVIIEERLTGPEVSLLCFSDGKALAIMPVARDHKRLLDDDQGPNTGGMGAFAPVPEFNEAVVAGWRDTFLKPAIAGLRAEGRPYTGVLYAGLMLSPEGPRLLEFNCRFGDPEAQVLLPLLESDFVELMLSCVDHQLDPQKVEWKNKSAATVVLASAGYPGNYEKGLPIVGADVVDQWPNCHVFQAGTKLEADELLTDGGRVLCVTALGKSLNEALASAYQGVAEIHFDGVQFRRDIGQKDKGRKSS